MPDLDFDEKTGVRTRSLRHELVKSVIFHFGLVLRNDSLLHLGQDSHIYLKLALCSLGPRFSLSNPEFGYCRPLHLLLGNSEPAGSRDNVICAEPSQLQKRCVATQALSADKYDSWCVGVALACAQRKSPFVQLEPMAPLNCLRALRNRVFLTCWDQFNVDPFLRLDPAHRISLRNLPGAPVLTREGKKALDTRGVDVQELISRALLALASRCSGMLAGQDAFTLLQIKLDLRTYVTAADKAAALCVCSLHDQALLLETERLLLKQLFDVVMPQLAVQFFEDEGPR